MKLVLIHGSGGTSLSFYYQLQHFRNAKGVDLPGHPHGKPCTSIEGYVEWLRGFCAARRYKDVVLCGHSMGGAIAQLYGLLYPDELKALVLIGTGARLRVHPNYLEQCRDNGQWLEGVATSLTGVAPDIKQAFLRRSREVGPQVALNDLLCCDRFDIMDQVGRISLPTLVVCGSEDVMTPIKYTDYLASQISGAQKAVFADATHYVHLQQPGKVNRAIEAFLYSLR